MNAPRPERVPQVPLAEVLGEAVALYGRNAPMFVTVAVAGALAGNLAGLVMSPSAFVVALIWSQIIAALITGLQAPVWLLAVLARKGEPLTGGAALYGVVTLLPRFFSVGLVLGVGGGALLLIAYYVPVLALPALPVLIYLAVRFSLSGPAIVLERCTPLQALVRSWQVVEGNWWRTFLIQLPVLLFAIILVAASGAASSAVESALLSAVAGAVALGVSAPLVALVETALFEEYSSRQPQAIEGEASE